MNLALSSLKFDQYRGDSLVKWSTVAKNVKNGLSFSLVLCHVKSDLFKILGNEKISPQHSGGERGR